MPEYTYHDRLAIMLEQSLWTAGEIMLKEAENDNSWGDACKDIANEILDLAAEVRDYNDQWEISE